VETEPGCDVWEYEYSVDTTAEPATIWAVFADVAGWSRWNAGVERIEIDGPFATGAVITMKPAGQDPVRLRIAELRPHELFVDEAVLGDVVVRTEHRLEPTGAGRTRIVYRTEITGPGADRVGPELGPAITEDFPDVLAALVKLTAPVSAG
jgi:uncharacterized protein YndB with AHSA1/START domain